MHLPLALVSQVYTTKQSALADTKVFVVTPTHHHEHSALPSYELHELWSKVDSIMHPAPRLSLDDVKDGHICNAESLKKLVKTLYDESRCESTACGLLSASAACTYCPCRVLTLLHAVRAELAPCSRCQQHAPRKN